MQEADIRISHPCVIPKGCIPPIWRITRLHIKGPTVLYELSRAYADLSSVGSQEAAFVPSSTTLSGHQSFMLQYCHVKQKYNPPHRRNRQNIASPGTIPFLRRPQCYHGLTIRHLSATSQLPRYSFQLARLLNLQ